MKFSRYTVLFKYKHDAKLYRTSLLPCNCIDTDFSNVLHISPLMNLAITCYHSLLGDNSSFLVSNPSFTLVLQAKTWAMGASSHTVNNPFQTG